MGIQTFCLDLSFSFLLGGSRSSWSNFAGGYTTKDDILSPHSFNGRERQKEGQENEDKVKHGNQKRFPERIPLPGGVNNRDDSNDLSCTGSTASPRHDGEEGVVCGNPS